MSESHDFHPTILREYDIRGIVGETLSEADARALGRAYASVIARAGEGRRICVGYDGRLSSPALEAALIDGLVAGGMEVLRVGRGPTPMLYYSTFRLDADGGVMVTGSHNPPDQNGFKMMIGRRSLFGERIAEIGRIAARGDYVEGRGSVRDHPLLDDYVDRLLADAPKADAPGVRPLSVAWDAGNGAAGEAMVRLTARLPGTHRLLYEEIDGRFPNHHADPTVPANLDDLIATVRGEGCDLGIAFDGDGDRIGVVDERGRILWGDQLLAILAADVLERHPGATIVADVKASQVLFDEVARHGGKPLMWRTGHSLIKAKMAETGAPLAGEMSGHIFFADGYYGFDDALYAAVRLLDILSRREETLGDLRDRLPAVVNTPELRFACDDARKFAIVETIRAGLEADGVALNAIDGVRVTTPDGWWLLRASNTQAVLVARCEAFDEAALARLKADLAGRLEAAGVSPPEF